ncbi:hypothetical protein JZ751_019978, partial [Albula glossodonta]
MEACLYRGRHVSSSLSFSAGLPEFLLSLWISESDPGPGDAGRGEHSSDHGTDRTHTDQQNPALTLCLCSIHTRRGGGPGGGGGDGGGKGGGGPVDAGRGEHSSDHGTDRTHTDQQNPALTLCLCSIHTRRGGGPGGGGGDGGGKGGG